MCYVAFGVFSVFLYFNLAVNWVHTTGLWHVNSFIVHQLPQSMTYLNSTGITNKYSPRYLNVMPCSSHYKHSAWSSQLCFHKFILLNN